MCGLRYHMIHTYKIEEICFKKKYWESGVDCLERAMGSSWWEWLVGYI